MGGSGGGQGSSGKIDYPGYMKDLHSVLYSNMNGHYGRALSKNPFTGMVAHDPAQMIKEMCATVDYYDDHIQNFDPIELWNQVMEETPDKVFGLINQPAIDTMLDSQKQRMRRSLDNEILPAYRRGMQNIGAVMTSAYKIGEALLWEAEIKEETNLEMDIKGKLSVAAYENIFKASNELVQLTLQKIAYHKDVVHYNLEVLRMGYSAQKEYRDAMNAYKVEGVKWPLEMSKYMMDALGCISSSAGSSYSTSSGGTNE